MLYNKLLAGFVDLQIDSQNQFNHTISDAILF